MTCLSTSLLRARCCIYTLFKRKRKYTRHPFSALDRGLVAVQQQAKYAKFGETSSHRPIKFAAGATILAVIIITQLFTA